MPRTRAIDSHDLEMLNSQKSIEQRKKVLMEGDDDDEEEDNIQKYENLIQDRPAQQEADPFESAVTFNENIQHLKSGIEE